MHTTKHIMTYAVSVLIIPRYNQKCQKKRSEKKTCKLYVFVSCG